MPVPPRLKLIAAISGIAVSIAILLVIATSLYVEHRYASRVAPLRTAPEAPVAIVFGAGLGGPGVPSPVLAERLDAAIALYRAGKVKKLLLSGDNSEAYHDETDAMRRYAAQAGLPQEALLVDDAGLSTYDTCFRARNTYAVERALLVTQDFHLPRALFIANSLGIDAHGVAADESRPGGAAYEFREVFKRSLALAMIVARPEPSARAR